MLLVLMFVLNIHFPIIPEFPMEAATGNGTTGTLAHTRQLLVLDFIRKPLLLRRGGGRNELDWGGSNIFTW